jgi:glycosyltransferase involved in cell wall biosynthesis
MSGTVAILLALHRSKGHLGDLLGSLSGQRYGDWALHAALDGEDDGTVAMVRAFADKQPQQTILQAGPCRGFAANFLDLLSNVGPQDQFAAFCDHDDVWLPDKLSRAVGALAQLPPSEPALYASRSIVCDRWLSPLALSPHPNPWRGFRDALTRSIASGNTMVLNRAGIELLQQARADGGSPAFHDWWAYQLVLGVGGNIVFDPTPSLLYRQHGRNLLGSSVAWQGKLRRLRAILKGDRHRWTSEQIEALRASRHRLLPENQQVLDQFGAPRPTRPMARPGRVALPITEK